jgi:hypothetical protein
VDGYAPLANEGVVQAAADRQGATPAGGDSCATTFRPTLAPLDFNPERLRTLLQAIELRTNRFESVRTHDVRGVVPMAHQTTPVGQRLEVDRTIHIS